MSKFNEIIPSSWEAREGDSPLVDFSISPIEIEYQNVSQQLDDITFRKDQVSGQLSYKFADHLISFLHLFIPGIFPPSISQEHKRLQEEYYELRLKLLNSHLFANQIETMLKGNHPKPKKGTGPNF